MQVFSEMFRLISEIFFRSNYAISDELVAGDEDLLNKSRYDADLPSKILIHGWTHSRNTPWMVEMREGE